MSSCPACRQTSSPSHCQDPLHFQMGSRRAVLQGRSHLGLASLALQHTEHMVCLLSAPTGVRYRTRAALGGRKGYPITAPQGIDLPAALRRWWDPIMLHSPARVESLPRLLPALPNDQVRRLQEGTHPLLSTVHLPLAPLCWNLRTPVAPYMGPIRPLSART